MTPVSEPKAPDPGLTRYAPGRPFPPYRFVPGLNPHPVSHPQGHSFRGGAHEPPPARLDIPRWRESEEYLYGCDLYNFAYWWEAHEAWEGLWHLTTKSDSLGLFLQGLIQLSASQLKRHMGEPVGTEKLATLGLDKLALVAAAVKPGERFLGVDIGDFSRAARAYLLERSPEAGFPFLRLAFDRDAAPRNT